MKNIYKVDIYPPDNSEFILMNFDVSATSKEEAETITKRVIAALGMPEGTEFERVWVGKHPIDYSGRFWHSLSIKTEIEPWLRISFQLT